ncbi:MAG: CRISPR-associated protein Cas4 [Chloroflexi bacterium]|nr:CRISPR-associated protein Cas4 [Chloroflexota bacterium]
MLDQEDRPLFTITDLKQYIYCPRVFYYHTCLPDVRPVTYKMEAGIAAHETEPKRAARRSLEVVGAPNGIRHFEVAVLSRALGLTGRIDEVIETATEFIPVDYKLARQAGDHFKIQLAAYAMLLEEQFQIKIKGGLLYLIPLRKSLTIPITPALRQKVEQALEDMRRIAITEWMPAPPANHRQCVDCEFRRFCNDV